MRKNLLFTTLFLSLFLAQNLKAQTIDSVTVSPLICHGDLTSATCYITQAAPATLVQYRNYRFAAPAFLMAEGSSFPGMSPTFSFPDLVAGDKRMVLVDSVAFEAATAGMTLGQVSNYVLANTDPAVYPVLDFFDYTVSGPPSAITVIETIVFASTFTSNDGSIALAASGGMPFAIAPEYIIEWIGPPGFISFDQDINNLSAGSYSLTMFDSLGCAYVDTFLVGVNPSPPNISVIDVLCNGESTGSIGIDGVVDFLAPTGPFNYYLFEGSVASSPLDSSVSADTFCVFNNLPANTYMIKVSSPGGGFIDAGIINQPASIGITTTATGVSSSLACDGQITATAVGGSGTYTYSWDTSPIQTSATATGLCVGDYVVTVTDSLGCFATQLDSVNSCANPIQLTVIVNPETCRGGDGSLQILAHNGAAPYSYSIDGVLVDVNNGAPDTVLIDSLSSGSYLVTVQDSFCILDSSLVIEVTPNPIIDSITVINESCCGDDGQIIVSAQNPLAIVKYSIDTLISWQSGNILDSLYRGSYLVHIEDVNSCIDSMPVYIGVDSVSDIDMSTEAKDVRCHGEATGLFTILDVDNCYDYFLYFTDTLTPLTLIDTGSYFTNLTVGVYGIIATSKSGTCTDSSVGRIIDEPDPIIYEPISSAVYCMNNDSCNGSITLDSLLAGGIFPYSYSVQELYVNIPLAAIDVDSTFFGICPGQYEVEVVDANNCSVLDTIEVLDFSLYIDSLITTDISCLDSSDGIITTYLHGGLAPYSYLWSNGDTTQTIDSLLPGSYHVVVTDSASCIALDTTVIITPDKLEFLILTNGKIPETCMGVTYDGQVILKITGGTAPYNYSWFSKSDSLNNGSGSGGTDTSLTMDSLTYSLITISVSDTNGCPSKPLWITSDSTQIDALNATNPLILDTVLIGSSPMCFGSSDGTLQIYIDQGDAPYLYSIDNGVTQSSDSIFTYLSADTFNIVVYDTYGCMDYDTVWLEAYAPLLITVDSIKDINCYLASDGYISVSASGGAPGYSYLWSTGATTNFLSGLSIGTYSVQVTDFALCMVTDTISLKYLTNPIQSSDLMINNVDCYGDSTGNASIQIIGGMPFWNGDYTVSWVNSLDHLDTISFENSAYYLAAGIYLVTITDSFLCGPFIDTIVITQPSQFYVDTIDVKGNLCAGYENGEISIAAFGGTAPYSSYFISSSSSSSSPVPVFTNLVENFYSFWSIDNNDCPSDTLFGIKLGDPGKIYIDSIKVTDLSCFQSDDGKIDLSILSGNPPYQYQLLDGTIPLAQGTTLDAILFSILDLPASDFTLHISDANACEIDTQISISQPVEVVANFVVNNNSGRESFTTSFENLSSEGANVFVWDFGDGISANNDDRVVYHTFINQGEYIVKLIAHDSTLSDLCNDEISFPVDVEGYDVFNAFSPNDDDINDVFYFENWMLKDINVEIFNRWGQQVYHWNGVDGSWNGMSYNGEKLPAGIYFYSMDAQGVDGYSFQENGSVTLFR